jgi:catechol 2,3-dioxygenase-like lactoylglutathione lyase family enzyme
MQGFGAPGAGFGEVVQVAYLVADIDRAMEQWVRHAGLGPWTCFRNIRLDACYEGKPLELAIHEGLAYVGKLQIQLVQSLDPPEVATPYQADLLRGRFGLHHVAFFAHDVDADIARAERQGFERSCEMRDAQGHRYFYCRSKAMPDVWIELLEFHPFLEQVFREGIAASKVWDGSDPIRNFEYADLVAR